MLIITVDQRQNLVLGEYVKIRYKNLFLSSSLVDANSKFVNLYKNMYIGDRSHRIVGSYFVSSSFYK